MRPQCVGIANGDDASLNRYMFSSRYALETAGNATVTTTFQEIYWSLRIRRQRLPIEHKRPYESPADAHNKLCIVQRRNRIGCLSDRYSPGAIHGGRPKALPLMMVLPDAATFCYLSGRGAFT